MIENRESTASIKARKLDVCTGCGEFKSIGCIVCWQCFKFGDNPFKYADLSLLDWLKTIPVVNWKAKIARSGL